MKRRFVFLLTFLTTLCGFVALPSTQVEQAQAAGLSIGGTVWQDTNADGVRQPGEPPLPHVPIQLGRLNQYGVPEYYDAQGLDLYRDANGRFVQSDSFGMYEFSDLEPGEYIVRIRPSGGGTPFFLTFPQRQGTGEFAQSMTLTSAGANADFGLHRQTAIPTVRGYAWIDGQEQPMSNTVRAFIDQVDCTTNSPSIIPPHDRHFAIGVAPASLIPECGEPGKTVRFTISGRPANETLIWGVDVQPGPPSYNPADDLLLTVGAPFAVYSIEALGDDGLYIYVPELVIEAQVDGVPCGRSESYGQGGMRIVLKSREGGGCGYEGANVTFRLAGRQVGESKWHAGMHEGPTVRIGRGSLTPPLEQPETVTQPTEPSEPTVAPGGSCCGPRAGSVIQPPSVGDGGLLGR